MDSPNERAGDSLPADDRADQFIQLLAAHERQLAAYVLTFVSTADADDILQETKIWLWRSFDQFTLGTSFGAWARQAAFFRIQQFHRKRSKENRRLVFSDECLAQLAEAFERQPDVREQRMSQLTDCVARLSAEHRRILSLRYAQELLVEDVASQIERTVSATYRVLSRIRLTLRQCVGDAQSSSSPGVTS
ncbi:MAG: sigma-70 family RNA polymerase sigma factor [Planctomycetaceae bacterium]|nr:sigma-70 family RNA polymerase sigma factor [Planctomycetaceae bacterium]